MSDQALLEAVNDLGRILVAMNPEITSKSEAIRRLHLAAVKPARIAALLSMPTKDVTSLISKLGKTNGGRKDRRRE